MKSMKVALAAIIVAALMVTPIVLFSVDDTPTEADPNYEKLAAFMASIDWDKFGELNFETPSLTKDLDNVPVSTSDSFEYGEWLYLEANYIFSNDAVITFEEGSYLTICPTQAFSIACTNANQYGGLVFEEGSKIALVTNGNVPSSDEQTGNIIAEIEVPEGGFEIYFNGKLSYDMPGWEFVFTVAKDTVLTGPEEQGVRTGYITFPAENKLDVKVTHNDYFTNVSISVKAPTVNIKAFMGDQMEDEFASLEGSIDHTISIVNAATQTVPKDTTITITGQSSIAVDIQDIYKANVSFVTDNVVIKMKQESALADPTVTLSGTVSLSISTDEMTDYHTEDGSMIISVKDAKATYTMGLNNETINGELDVTIGKYDLTIIQDTGNEVISIDNLKVYAKYTGEIVPEDDSPVIAAPVSPQQSKEPSLPERYMSGVKNLTSAEEIKAYASEFFLGEFDKSAGFDAMDISTTSVKAEISIGAMSYGGYKIKGLNLNAEINESVGVYASASLDSYSMNDVTIDVKQMSIPMPNVTVGSSNITLATCTDLENKAMFDCDFSTSFEIKAYDYNGVLLTDNYVKGAKGSITTSDKPTVINSLTADEIVYSTYGIKASISNASLDTETACFTAEEVKVGGNYYYGNAIKSIDGTYANASISVKSLMSSPSFTADSVTMRITAINGSTMDFSRTYDATEKVITNTYDVDGVMYFADVYNDYVLNGLMIVELNDVDDLATEVNKLSGGILVPGGTSTEMGSNPALVVSGTDYFISYGGLSVVDAVAPGNVYVSTTFTTGESTGPGAMTVNDNTISLNLTGVAVGVFVDKDGVVTYGLLALPGYTLSENMTHSGFTISDCSDKTATITITGTSVSCSAIPDKYKISIDGQVVKEDVGYGTSVTGVTVDPDALYAVDPYGTIIGNISSGTWNLGTLYYFTSDLNLTTVKGVELTTVSTEAINNVEAEAAKFEVPAGGSSLQFAMSSKVRFDLSGLTAGNTIDLVAQQTTYDGKDAFVIKAERGGFALASTLYIPVSGDGNKLMHVDEYGRVTQVKADNVVVGEQNYLKATVTDYSIFYAEADKPAYDDGGNGGNGTNWLLIGGIVAVVAVVAIAGAVFFIKKH